ncbi:MAG TPA: beta-ketoacyl-ACP synthase II [Anaerolineae bacterium]|nr:beta-ketoacyl-ACP synthase II [Anaerolineae bacterium]
MRRRELQSRVVITGLGMVTALGLNVDETWQALIAGKSGIAAVTRFDASELPVRIGGEVKGFDPAGYMDRKEVRRTPRCAHLALAAATEAMADAGLGNTVPDPDRSGVVMGVANGGVEAGFEGWETLKAHGPRRIPPFMLTAMLPNMPAFHLGQRFQCRGFNSTVTTACASGTQAIGEAAEAIRRGAADLMLAGGAESMISLCFYVSLSVLRVLTTDNEHPERAMKPFDARRDGFACAEGAAVMVLERLDRALERGARIYGEVLGYAANTDAHHFAIPDPVGAGAARCMKWAIENAGIAPGEVDYINAHGPATEVGDRTETTAIKALFGEHAYRVPVSSTKSMIGHASGAAGAIEAVVCVKTMDEAVIHPTINYEVPDPDCDLDYVPNVARRADVDIVLSNSFGLGGQNACLVMAKY